MIHWSPEEEVDWLGLREWDDDSLRVIDWKDRSVAFVRGGGTHLRYVHTVTGKRAAISERGQLLVAWTGNYRTDFFLLDAKARRLAKAALARRPAKA